jgi:hypothetical protein
MTIELEMIWKEAAVDYFKTSSRDMLGESVENCEKLVRMVGHRAETRARNFQNTKQKCGTDNLEYQ